MDFWRRGVPAPTRGKLSLHTCARRSTDQLASLVPEADDGDEEGSAAVEVPHGQQSLGRHSFSQHVCDGGVLAENECEETATMIYPPRLPAAAARQPPQTPPSRKKEGGAGGLMRAIMGISSQNSPGSAADDASDRASSAGGLAKRKSGANSIIEAASVLYNNTNKMLTWEKHWEATFRAREFDSLVKKLTKLARQCGGILSDRRAVDLSSNLFKLATTLEDRQKFIVACRTAFSELVTADLSTVHKIPVESCPDVLKGEIIMNGCYKLVDAAMTDPSVTVTFLRTIEYVKPRRDANKFSLAFVYNPGVKQGCQEKLINNFVDVLFRQLDGSIVLKVLTELNRFFADTPISFDAQDITPSGWSPTSWPDMQCLRLCGQVSMVAPVRIVSTGAQRAGGPGGGPGPGPGGVRPWLGPRAKEKPFHTFVDVKVP